MVTETSTNFLLKPRRFEDWVLGVPFDIKVPRFDIPYLVAVGGGKGGVGKTFVAANLAAKLASMGHEVLLIDFDVGGANLHTYFGLGLPKKTLGDLLQKKNVSFNETIVQTPFKGVRILPGSREDAWHVYSNWTTDLFRNVWHGIFNAKTELGVDCIVFDLGAGIQQHTIDFFAAAHSGLVVVLPEPTSIENAYMFLKASLWHLVNNVCHMLAMNEQEICNIKSFLTSESVAAVLAKGGYLTRLRLLAAKHPVLAHKIFRLLQGREVGLLLNQVRCQKDIDVGKSMEHICKNYFGFLTRYFSFLNYDETAWKSLRNQRLLVSDFPHSILAKRFNDVALKIGTVVQR